MNARALAAEEAVLAEALRRGLVGQAQLDGARRAHAEALLAGRPSALLALIAPHLRPADREALRLVYARALQEGGSSADDADAEATAVLDMPAAAPPPSTSPSRPGPASAPPSAPPSTSGAASAPAPASVTPGATVADVRPPVVAETLVVGPPGATLAAPPPAGIAAAPTEIGGFSITRELGRGGMGVVYEAAHPRHGAVALKVLLAGDLATSEDVERFKLEARASSSLEHPNVVRVLEHGQDALGRWYMAMELVEGESLEALVRREGPLPTLVAARVARDVARALEAAHARSILHRDVKPHNVLMDGDTPRLTDFGLAKLTGDAKSRSLTASGPGVLGTPGYMAPEQAGGERKRIDVRADVYGVGSLLYHLLTGRPPFEGESLASVLVAVLQKAPTPPSQRRPGLPRDLETICLKCLEKDPQNRYPTAKALADDLERFIGAEEIAARPPGALTLVARAARAHGPASALAAAGALALVVGVGLAIRASLGGVAATVATATDAPPVPATETRPGPAPEAPPAPVTEAAPATEAPPAPATEVPPAPGTEAAPAPVTETPLAPAEAGAERATEATPTPTTHASPAQDVGRSPESTPGEPLDPLTIQWLAARSEALVRRERVGSGLAWAPGLAAGWREAQDRGIPLLVVVLGYADELPPWLLEARSLERLNAAVVPVLAQKKERDGEHHRQRDVGGELRCDREPLLTCEQHHEAYKRLKDDDADDRVLPGPPIEQAKQEDCRLVVVVPDGTRAMTLSDEPEKTGLPAVTAANLEQAIERAVNAAGGARVSLAALVEVGKALELARRLDKLGDAIKDLRALSSEESAPELVRAFAAYQLEAGLVARVEEFIRLLRQEKKTTARRELRRLRREVSSLPACVERVDSALALLD